MSLETFGKQLKTLLFSSRDGVSFSLDIYVADVAGNTSNNNNIR